MFEQQAAALGRKPLFFVKRQGAYQPISWQQAHEDVQALGIFLLSQEVNAGDRILILSENRPEWGMADVAIQSIGAWTVPIYPSLPSADIETICRDCAPVIGLASTREQLQKLLEVAGRLPTCLRLLVVFDPSPNHNARVLTWTEALSAGREAQPRLAELARRRREQMHPEDTTTLIYTSGTTGEPKGVMLSHHNFLSNVEACLQVMQVGPTDLHLSFLPLCHVFERMAGWYLMLSAGASVAYAENMDTIPQNMLEIRPSVMLGVPRFFEKLYGRIQEGLRQASGLKRISILWALRVGGACAARHQANQPLSPWLRLQRSLTSTLVLRKLHEKLGGRLRFFISGSAPLSKAIGEFFFRAGITILEGYGLTETSPVIAVNRLPVPRFGSVGPLIPGVEVNIAEDGEILTRGPHVMQGYYHKPEATSAVMADGWFATGDIGRLDEHGYLYITDRKKDLIKTAGGKFISPQKLENLLITEPAISQAFVFGDKRPYCVALLVPNIDHLRRYAQEQHMRASSTQMLIQDPRIHAWYWSLVQAKQQPLASFEQLKKIALLDQEFSQAAGELTPTMKAKRAVIAQHHHALLERLYEPTTP